MPQWSKNILLYYVVYKKIQPQFTLAKMEKFIIITTLCCLKLIVKTFF